MGQRLYTDTDCGHRVTISPYEFFWQSNEEVEELVAKGAIPGNETRRPKTNLEDIGFLRWDTLFGMFFSNVITFFIIITAAATLNANGHKDVQSAMQAAELLRPLSRVIRVRSVYVRHSRFRIARDTGHCGILGVCDWWHVQLAAQLGQTVLGRVAFLQHDRAFVLRRFACKRSSHSAVQAVVLFGGAQWRDFTLSCFSS